MGVAVATHGTENQEQGEPMIRIASVIAGTIKLAIDTLAQNVPSMKDGRLRALAVTSPGPAMPPWSSRCSCRTR
jgi:hypothetical protein